MAVQRLSTLDRWLASTACTAAGCNLYIAHRGAAKIIKFYGLPQDIAVAVELFAWLRDQLARCAAHFVAEAQRQGHHHVNGRSVETSSFKDGFCHGVMTRARKEADAQRTSRDPIRATQKASSAATSPGSLVVLTKDLLEAREAALDSYASKLCLRRSARTYQRSGHDAASYRRRHVEGSSTSTDRDTVQGD